MYQHYPPAVQRWVKTHGAMERILPLTYLKAPEVWTYVPRCLPGVNGVRLDHPLQ
jgi:hypothetical protein